MTDGLHVKLLNQYSAAVMEGKRTLAIYTRRGLGLGPDDNLEATALATYRSRRAFSGRRSRRPVM
jgi:hypothetical protein